MNVFDNNSTLCLGALLLAAVVVLPSRVSAADKHGREHGDCCCENKKDTDGEEHHGWFRRLFHHDDDDRKKRNVNCGCDSSSEECRVRLEIGTVGYSIWDDGSVAMAIPIVNVGDSPAANVQVSSLSLGKGKRAKPAALPVALGEIVSDQRAVLQSRFTSLSVSGNYLLEVSGTYTFLGKSRPFSAQLRVAIARPAPGPVSPTHVVVPKHATSGVPTAPSPIPQENDNNPAGPPIPDGPVIHPFPVPPSSTGAAPFSAGGSNVTFIRDTGTGQATGYPPDPTTATGASGDGVVFSSGNSYVLFSKDDGVTFTRIDPTTIFPQSDGGLCCDQVVLYNPRVNLFFWLIQYNSSAPNPPSTTLPGPNRLRIAWATPASMKANINSWTYFDLQSSTFNLGNQALDFPDLAFTGQFLYASVDRVTSLKPTGGTNVQGLIVARIPLSDITGSGPNVGITYLGPNETGDQNTATGSRLTQNSLDAMYWGGQVDSSHIKVFRWPDSSNNLDPRHDAKVNTYCQNDYSTLAPDNQQWLDNTRTSATSIIGATRKPFSGLVAPGSPVPNGEIWLAWGSGRDEVGSAPCTQGRPQPYVKIARVDDQTLDTVGEYHIWNSAFAFAYPALATDPNSNIGVSVAFGGPGNFASTTVGYLGDFVVYFVEASDVTVTFTQSVNGKVIVDSNNNPVLFTRYGDFFCVRNSGPSNTDFSSEGYAVKLVDSTKSKNCSNAPGCAIRMHYEQWGRPAAPPPH